MLSLNYASSPNYVFNNSFSVPINDVYSLIDYYRIIAIQNQARDKIWTNPRESINNLLVAEQLADLHNFKQLKWTNYTIENLAYIGLGEFKQSFDAAQKGKILIDSLNIPFFKKINSFNLISINEGAAYFYNGNFEKALQQYYLVLKNFERYSTDNRNVIMAYNNIADALLHIDKVEEADYYLNKAATLITDKSSEQNGYILSNKAEVFLRKSNLIDAEKYCNLAKEIGIKENNLEITQGALLVLGKVKLKQNKPQDCINILTDVLNMKVKTFPYYAKIVPKYTIGEAYNHLLNYKKSIDYINTALHESENLKINEEKLNALNILANDYYHLNNLPKAYSTLKTYASLKDSLRKERSINAAAQMDILFKTAQKDKAIAENNLLLETKDHEIQFKNLLLLFGTIALVLILGSAFILSQLIKNKRKIDVINAAMDGEEKERSRIARELHDGVGAYLAATQMLISEEDTPNASKISQLLNETATLVRQTSHNISPEAISKFSLQESLSTYVQNIQSKNSVQIDLQFLTPIPALNYDLKLAIYRIIQELIQNIIKHANANHASIQLSKNINTLQVVVEDDGTGFSTSSVSSGIGLKNIQSRVELIKGTYLLESSLGNGTIVTIEIPE